MGRYAFDQKGNQYVNRYELIQEYQQSCMEFCLEWTNWTEESLLGKHEEDFFRIFLQAKERQAMQQKMIEKNNPNG